MTKRRWLKSAIITSQQPQPALPFQRTNPAAFKPAPQAAPRALAAR